jgi:hypothetical protein
MSTARSSAPPAGDDPLGVVAAGRRTGPGGRGAGRDPGAQARGPRRGDVAAVGAPADGEPEHVLHGAHWTARHHSLDLLAGIHGDRLIAVVGGRHDPLASGRLLLALFGPGPVVLGPAVPDLAAAGRRRGLRLGRARRSRSWERPRRWRSCTASGWPPYRPDTPPGADDRARRRARAAGRRPGPSRPRRGAQCLDGTGRYSKCAGCGHRRGAGRARGAREPPPLTAPPGRPPRAPGWLAIPT